MEYTGLFQLSEQRKCSPRQFLPKNPHNEAIQQAVQPILDDIGKLKQALLLKDTSSSMATLSELQRSISVVFSHQESIINDLFGTDSVLDDATKQRIAEVLQEEYQPILSMSPIYDRVVSKPQGYAGDFLTIEWIYENKPRTDEIVGHLIDKEFLALTGAVAVQNRRKILKDAIRTTIQENRHGGAAAGTAANVQITSMACGPARELYDLFVENDSEMTNVDCHLIDLDGEALSFVRDWQNDIRASQSVNTYQKNLIHLTLGKEAMDIPQQDLMYSMGLIDYFSDKTVIRLLNYAYDMLKPGGKVMLGQFHKSNPSRGMMDTMMEWKLIHRDEDDMNRIFMASKFGCGASEIIFDGTGVQMWWHRV